MKYTFDNVTRIIITAIIAVAIMFLVYYLRTVLLPFLIGWLLAYLLNPLVNFVQNKMKVKRRGLSIAISLIIVILVVTGCVMALVPMVGSEMDRASTLITEFTKEIPNKEALPMIITSVFEEITRELNIDQLFTLESIDQLSQRLLPQVWNLLSGTWQVVAALFVVFVTFLYTIFILLDYNTISKGFIKLIPQKYSQFIVDLLEDVELGMNKYFRGQLLIALIVGTLFAIGFKLIGLPLAITIGLFIGVLNIVPYMQTLGLIPVPLLALLQSMETGQNFWVLLALCVLVFIIVQGIQDLLLVPKIMGKAMGLNPAIILLSLSVWGALMGLTGMIIALPFTTILVAYYKRYVLHLEAEPFAMPDTSDIVQPNEPQNIEEPK